MKYTKGKFLVYNFKQTHTHYKWTCLYGTGVDAVITAQKSLLKAEKQLIAYIEKLEKRGN